MFRYNNTKLILNNHFSVVLVFVLFSDACNNFLPAVLFTKINQVCDTQSGLTAKRLNLLYRYLCIETNVWSDLLGICIL